ncbi:MAG TPA: hypothetical protein VF945_20865 [Polyangia bacterium]
MHPRAVDGAERRRMFRAHLCWQDTWSAMLRDLDGAELRFSDDFSRQDEIGALFCGDECVGLSGYRFVDLSLPWLQRDSYFAPWPAPLVEQIAAATPRVCVGSNLVVAPSWRGALTPMRVSEMLLALAVQRFTESDAQIMLGTMRNDRRMNHISYRMGAMPLRTNVMHHHVAVDLVMFTRNTVDDIGLPPIQWVRAASRVEETSHEERIGKLRRTTG